MSSFHCRTFCFLFQQPQMSDFLSHSIARFWTVLYFWCYSDLERTFPSSPLQKKKTKQKTTRETFRFFSSQLLHKGLTVGTLVHHLIICCLKGVKSQKSLVLPCPWERLKLVKISCLITTNSVLNSTKGTRLHYQLHYSTPRPESLSTHQASTWLHQTQCLGLLPTESITPVGLHSKANKENQNQEKYCYQPGRWG